MKQDVDFKAEVLAIAKLAESDDDAIKMIWGLNDEHAEALYNFLVDHQMLCFSIHGAMIKGWIDQAATSPGILTMQ